MQIFLSFDLLKYQQRLDKFFVKNFFLVDIVDYFLWWKPSSSILCFCHAAIWHFLNNRLDIFNVYQKFKTYFKMTAYDVQVIIYNGYDRNKFSGFDGVCMINGIHHKQQLIFSLWMMNWFIKLIQSLRYNSSLVWNSICRFYSSRNKYNRYSCNRILYSHITLDII